MKDVHTVLSNYPGSTVEKKYLGPTPQTVDVPHEDLGEEFLLPESQQQPFNP